MAGRAVRPAQGRVGLRLRPGSVVSGGGKGGGRRGTYDAADDGGVVEAVETDHSAGDGEHAEEGTHGVPGGFEGGRRGEAGLVRCTVAEEVGECLRHVREEGATVEDGWR